MTNVEKMREIGILEFVRQSQGADDGDDTSRDEIINNLSTDDLMSEWCKWEFGDRRWWNDLKSFIKQLEEMEKNNL